MLMDKEFISNTHLYMYLKHYKAITNRVAISNGILYHGLLIKPLWVQGRQHIA